MNQFLENIFKNLHLQKLVQRLLVSCLLQIRINDNCYIYLLPSITTSHLLLQQYSIEEIPDPVHCNDKIEAFQVLCQIQKICNVIYIDPSKSVSPIIDSYHF